MWSVECKVWWSVGCKVGTVECKVWSVKCGVRGPPLNNIC